MSEMPVSQQRSQVRTAMLVVISIGLPRLCLMMGGIEMGYGNYRFGAMLILLATVAPFVLLAFF